MPGFLKQSTASQSRAIGPFLDDTDFKTPETGLTIANTDIKLVVNGGASANKNSGGGTHRVNGVYGITFDATDTATVGEMEVSVVVAGALPVFDKFTVVEEAVYDALFASSAPGYLQPTTAGRTLDVSAGGEAGLDWANIGSPTTSQTLSGTTVGTATAVTTVNGLAANVITATAIQADAITAAKIATGAIDADAIADNAIDAGAIAASAITAAKIATDAIGAAQVAADAVTKIQNGLATPTNITAGTITTVTNLTNAPTAGDFTATMKTSIGTAVAASAVASVTGNVGGNVVGSVGSVTGNVGGNVAGSVGSVTGNVGGNVVGSVASVTAAVSVTGDLSATMKTSVQTAAAAAITAAEPIAADVTKINGTTLTGNGGGTPWGPA